MINLSGGELLIHDGVEVTVDPGSVINVTADGVLTKTGGSDYTPVFETWLDDGRLTIDGLSGEDADGLYQSVYDSGTGQTTFSVADALAPAHLMISRLGADLKIVSEDLSLLATNELQASSSLTSPDWSVVLPTSSGVSSNSWIVTPTNSAGYFRIYSY